MCCFLVVNLFCIFLLLLRNGALTHFVNHEGETAYHIAAKSENFK